MLIKYLGHSAFLMRSRDGVRIITDPYSPTQGVNYRPIKEEADIVTISHKHWDHNEADAVRGNPDIIRKEGREEAKGIRIIGIPSYHDTSGGRERGKNIIYIYEVEGMRVCHLGDLGHELSEEQISRMGKIDICFIPVGGTYTIGPEEAKRIIEAIDPKIVIPMHFKTPSLNFPITGVEEFIYGVDNVIRVDSSEYDVEKEKLPLRREIVVLSPALL